MGYTTDFRGQFTCEPALNPKQVAYLKAFADTRRVRRDFDKASIIADDVRIDAGVPLGKDACYFTGSTGFMGQDNDPSVVASNTPPADQPSLWCQWVPTEDGKGIKWDGGEKFRSYIPWLEYIINHFLTPWGVVLNGRVQWRGEDWSDIGTITVRDSNVDTLDGVIMSS